MTETMTHRAGIEVRPRGVHAGTGIRDVRAPARPGGRSRRTRSGRRGARGGVGSAKAARSTRSRPPRRVALGHRACLALRRPASDRLAGRPDGRGKRRSRCAFTPEGDGTRVELERRGWERLGAMGAEGRESYGSEKGWEMVVGRSAAAWARRRRRVARRAGRRRPAIAGARRRIGAKIVSGDAFSSSGTAHQRSPNTNSRLSCSHKRRGCGSNAGVRTRWYCSAGRPTFRQKRDDVEPCPHEQPRARSPWAQHPPPRARAEAHPRQSRPARFHSLASPRRSVCSIRSGRAGSAVGIEDDRPRRGSGSAAQFRRGRVATRSGAAP